MNFKVLKSAVLATSLLLCQQASAALITINFSGTDASNASNYYLARIVFDNTIAGTNGFNTKVGIVDFSMQTFGANATSFSFADVGAFYWLNAYGTSPFAQPQNGQLSGSNQRAWIALGVSNQNYRITQSNYIYQQMYTQNGTPVVSYVNDPVGTRQALPTAAVSAPSTLAVFALGLMGLVARRFKKSA